MSVSTPNNNDILNELDEETPKTFTFRAIPPRLHKQWKIIASVAGKSMEEFGLDAIENYINYYLKSQKEEFLKAVGGK